MTVPPPTQRYVVGVDFGTLSGRALVVRVSDGAELGTAVLDYPHGVMDTTLTAGDGQALPPEWALQNPGDYLEVLRRAVPEAIAAAGIDPADVIGVGVDVTASTMLPTLADGTPLCELDEFRHRPHAYVKLWKHHAAQAQAEQLTRLLAERDPDRLARYGGLVSSEWQFPKALQLLTEDPEIYARADHLVEANDWIVWQLGGRLTRNACTVGYKGLHQDGSYPDPDVLGALNPDFATVAHDLLSGPVVQLGERAGALTAEAAAWTGLPEGIAVAAGNVDAHVTAPAADAVQPGQMTLIMGTSTCHILSDHTLHVVPGMCGVVDGGIVAGLQGYEAGQSGVGDIFAWFVTNAVPAAYRDEAERRGLSLHELLTEKAARQAIGQHGLLALDWWSGNRSVLVDHELSGLLVGMNLQTRPEDIYRALLEATAFGTRVIVENYLAAGVPVTELVAAGGLLKNEFLMQLYADVTGLTLSTIVSTQGPALGSAIHAAVAARAYPSIGEAAAAMGARVRDAYSPDPAAHRAYQPLFDAYVALHDHFGRGGSDVMKQLKNLRRTATAPTEKEIS